MIIVFANQLYIQFKTLLKAAKLDKIRLIQEEKIYNTAVENYRSLMRELYVVKLMIVRLSPYELIRASNQVSNMSQILELYPEKFNSSVLHTSGYSNILQKLVEENGKMRKYHNEYLYLSEQKESHLKALIEQETRLDSYFAEIWAVIQSTQEEGNVNKNFLKI